MWLHIVLRDQTDCLTFHTIENRTIQPSCTEQDSTYCMPRLTGDIGWYTSNKFVFLVWSFWPISCFLHDLTKKWRWTSARNRSRHGLEGNGHELCQRRWTTAIAVHAKMQCHSISSCIKSGLIAWQLFGMVWSKCCLVNAHCLGIDSMYGDWSGAHRKVYLRSGTAMR